MTVPAPKRLKLIVSHLCFHNTPVAPIPFTLSGSVCLYGSSTAIVTASFPLCSCSSLSDRNMRLPSSLPCVLAVLAGLTVTYSLPTFDTVRSTLWGHQPSFFSRTKRSPQEAHYAHLAKRSAEIYELEKRQQVNCTDPYALFFTDCWKILNMKDYLVAPGTGWINTVRYCQNSGGVNSDNDGSNCCVANEPWSTCYLRLAIPGSAHDCTSPSGGRCTDGMINDIKVDPRIYPYVRYTVKNIYGTPAL